MSLEVDFGDASHLSALVVELPRPVARPAAAEVPAPGLTNAQHQMQPSAPQTDGETLIANSIIQSAQRLASSTVHSLDRTLPWLSGARELRDTIEVAFANHFERQIEDELALCGCCGSTRVSYWEREGPTGVSFDGCSEIHAESGYLCADCGAFEDSAIAFDPEVAA